MTTLVTYTGDGSTTDWTFSFDYLADDYVTFTILDAGNQNVSVNYTGELVSVSELRITPAADSGYTVRIQRVTAVQDDLFGFGAGGVMRPSDIAFAMKSVRDFSEEMAGVASAAVIDVDNATGSAAAAASSASEAQAAAANAQNVLNSVNNLYLGAYASDSAVATYVSNDANITLDEGNLYFNTTDDRLLYYTTGSGWLPAAATNVINTSSLDVVGDVTITSATSGDILRWNGTQWTNSPDSDYATSTQGSLADTAVQPGDLATVATSGSYNDLAGKPTLGTAAAAATTDFATEAQGSLADSATQPGDLATVATSGAYSDLTGTPTFGNIPQNAPTGAYVLQSGDAGKHVSIPTGGITVNTSVFSTGDAVTIFNNSGLDQTITQGTSVILYLAGDGGVGSKTLAGYGLATLLCVGTDTFVISGAGLS